MWYVVCVWGGVGWSGGGREQKGGEVQIQTNRQIDTQINLNKQ